MSMIDTDNRDDAARLALAAGVLDALVEAGTTDPRIGEVAAWLLEASRDALSPAEQEDAFATGWDAQTAP